MLTKVKCAGCGVEIGSSDGDPAPFVVVSETHDILLMQSAVAITCVPCPRCMSESYERGYDDGYYSAHLKGV